MISFFILLMLGFLVIVGIIDWKVQAIPSIMLTAMLFTVAIVYQENLLIGVLGFIMAWMLYEAEFYKGLADVKVFVIISFMLSSITQLFIFICLFMLFGMIWKGMWHWSFKRHKKKVPKTFPFLPVFVFVFVDLLLMRIIT